HRPDWVRETRVACRPGTVGRRFAAPDRTAAREAATAVGRRVRPRAPRPSLPASPRAAATRGTRCPTTHLALSYHSPRIRRLVYPRLVGLRAYEKFICRMDYNQFREYSRYRPQPARRVRGPPFGTQRDASGAPGRCHPAGDE